MQDFCTKAQKIKKIHPEKTSSYFGKFLTLRLKNVLYFFKRKLFLYFQKCNPALSDPRLKNKKIYPEKISYILILKNLLYFLKRKLYLYFRKPKLRKNFLYFLKRKLFLYFKKWKRLKLFVFQ